MTTKAHVMSVQGSVEVNSIGRTSGFADPEWRGAADDLSDHQALRPLVRIQGQIGRLATWIAGGADYGWLGAYQARRAAFELQSIRAQIDHATAQNQGRLPDDDRRAVQSRLDRLEFWLEAMRSGVGLG
jgi:hypothetical protein